MNLEDAKMKKSNQNAKDPDKNSVKSYGGKKAAASKNVFPAQKKRK